jgi:hypothetical protein
MPRPVPASEADLTADWLLRVLADGLTGGRTVLTSVERIGRDFGLASELYRCRLSGPEGPGSVVVKLWSTAGVAGPHEVRFYASFAPRLGIRVPACHFGSIDEEARRGVLVLEDIEGTQGDCLQQLEPRGAAAVADTMAALHAAWWGRRELGEADWVRPMLLRPPEWLHPRREEFLRRFGGSASATVRDLLDRVEQVEARAQELLDGGTRTLLHADLHLDNIVFEAGPERPVLLDWARVAKGPAVLDLAEVLFEMVPVDLVERTLEIYERGLERGGISRAGPVSFRRQIGGALLRKTVNATCGVARWEPTSRREERIIVSSLERLARAIENWGEWNPDLFDF